MTDKKNDREDATRPSVATPAAPAAKQGDGKRTPEEWAPTFGQVRPKTFEETITMVNGKPFDFVGQFLWQHEAAVVLHGWKLHAHHAGEPFRLSKADYEAALKAASETNEKGEYTPHPAALSPHAPKTEPKPELPEEEE